MKSLLTIELIQRHFPLPARVGPRLTGGFTITTDTGEIVVAEKEFRSVIGSAADLAARSHFCEGIVGEAGGLAQLGERGCPTGRSPAQASVTNAQLKGMAREGVRPEEVMTRHEFGMAYLTGRPTTIRLLLRRGLRREAAEEIAQASWVRGWECLSDLKDDRRVLQWVNSIAINMAISEFRRSRKLDQLVPQHAPITEFTSNVPAIDLARAMAATCSRRQQQLVGEVCILEYPCREVATKFSMSPNAVRSQLLRVRRAMREWMAPKSPNSSGATT